MFQLALLLLQLARQIIVIVERQKLLTEGRKQQIELELVAASKAAALSAAIKTEVDRMNESELDRALERDYRAERLRDN